MLLQRSEGISLQLGTLSIAVANPYLKVIRLPTNGRPILVEQQAQSLYAEIERACRLARNVKKQTRMLLNAFELQAYLYERPILSLWPKFAKKLQVIMLSIIFVLRSIPHLILCNVRISPAISRQLSARVFLLWPDLWR